MLVNLVLTDGRLGVFAYGLYAGPERARRPPATSTPTGEGGPAAGGLKRFTMTLPRIPMPWGMSPSSVTSAGSKHPHRGAFCSS